MERQEPVIAALRRASHARHLALESCLDLDGQVAFLRYGEALRGFEMFLSGWELRLRNGLPPRLLPWLMSRSRYAMARQDLDELHLERISDPHALAMCSSLLDDIGLESVDAMFGSMYVLEGSALGGQVIAKTACVSLGLGPHNGGAYFHGFGADTASHWREFRTALETEVGLPAAAVLTAATAAERTFDALIGIFSALRHAPAPG